MNSYPPELTYHAYTSMFVGGLSRQSEASGSRVRAQPMAAGSSQSRSASSRPPLSTASTSESAPTLADTSSPSKAVSNNAVEAAFLNGSPLVLHPTDLYPEFCNDLADVFQSRGMNSVWDPSRGKSTMFHSVLVDNNVRLPPRKTRPSPRTIAAPDPASVSHAPIAPRSPLSPLHPGSPLFPDGLIAPIWTRKHREIVPSIFVSFHCLVEPFEESAVSPANGSAVQGDQPKDSEDATTEPMRRALSGQELKARDDELIKLIFERKRTLAERGIKLTVVLLTSREMLSNPQLEARLSYIRRSSGLDTKASLFVLTPVDRREMEEFVSSLQAALCDHALDYYREQARRVRRKRSRYPPPLSIVQPIMQSVAASRPGGSTADLVPLSREGWHVRAEYKLAIFAEFSGDFSTALTHLQEAYDLLAGSRGMLANTMILPPRTKRWAEAKVLSDTISIRICRLHLYASEEPLAIAQFRRHIARFVELSTGWGIGDVTFEFWSWLSKQYRLLADLLEQASLLKSGSFTSPLFTFHAPPLPGFLLHPAIADNSTQYPSLKSASETLLSPNAAAIASGTSSAALLQEPGYYYYLAALCTEERRDRFVKMCQAEELGSLSEGGKTALVHEKKVDHSLQISEAFGKAHEVFRASQQPRLACLAAAKIGTSHAASAQSKMALRSLDRIFKYYKQDQFLQPLSYLLTLALQCAQESEDLGAEVKLLLEALAMGNLLGDEQRLHTEQRWNQVTSLPSQTEATPSSVIAFEAASAPLQGAAAFRHQTVDFGSSAAFQVTMSLPPSSKSLQFDVDEISMLDAEGQLLFRIEHESTASENDREKTLELHDLGSCSAAVGAKACLRWSGPTSRTFQGRLTPHLRDTLQLSAIVLHLSKPIPLDVRIQLPVVETSTLPQAPFWLSRPNRGPLRWVPLPCREDPLSCRVERPLYKVDPKVEYHPRAYLDEPLRVTIRLQNNDRQALSCSADVVLQAAYPGSQDELHQGGQPTLSGSLKDLTLGSIEPAQSASISFTIRGKHRAGPRSLSVFLGIVPDSTPTQMNGESSDEQTTSIFASETVHDVVIPFQRAFRADFSANWRAGALAASQTGGSLDSQPLSAGPSGTGQDRPRSPVGMSDRPASGLVIADLQASVNTLAPDALSIRDVRVDIEDEFQTSCRVLDGGEASESQRERQDSLQGQWKEGDRWAHSWDVEVTARPYEQSEGPRGPTGHLVITWSRSGDEVSEADATRTGNITRLPLPILAPPHTNARLLVAAPAVTHALQAFTVVFVVVNPSPSTVDVSIVIDEPPSSVWVLSHRTLSIPGIPARGSRSVPTRLIAKAQGTWVLPRVRAFQQRPREEMEMGWLLNETQYGLPLTVKFRASAGATLSGSAARAYNSGQVPAEQEGPSMSVLVLPRDEPTN